MTTAVALSTDTATDTATAAAVDVPMLLRRWRLVGLWALAVWLVLFVLWAALAPISGAVVGSGLVKVQANRQMVTHRDGGIVARILVREGEVVRKGQPLVQLEDARLDSSMEMLQSQMAAERLRVSRLEAEAALQPAWTPPPLPADATRARQALAREASAFDARRRTLQGQLDSVRLQMTETEAEISAHQRNNAASATALALLREEIESNEALLQENFVNRTRVMALKRGLADYESRMEESSGNLAQAKSRRTELEGRLASIRSAYVQAATEDLREATARIVDLEERLRAGQDTAQRQMVTSPVAGRLVDLRVNTIGSAIGAREPIVDIVPSEVPLVVEARIGAEAISEVAVGQSADVKLVGFRPREVGVLEGRVRQVSADALVEPRSGAPYFAVQIEVLPEALASIGHVTLLPGMAAEVYIRTSERSAVGFLLEPLASGLRRSFREY